MALDAPASMVPAGLNPGDQFYIIFVTSNTTLGNLSPAQFNTFVNGAADLSGAKGTNDPTITWRAWLGHDDGTLQTASLFDADNTQPIYNLNGDKVGDNYADLVDGSLDSAVAYNEAGANVGSVGVYTGTTAVGGALIAQGDNTLGGADSSNDGCALGRSDRVTGQAWALNVSGDQGCDDDDYAMYAVSPLLRVALPTVASYAGNLPSGTPFTLDIAAVDVAADFKSTPTVFDAGSLSPALPDTVELVDGALAFTIDGLTPGASIEVSVDYGAALPAGASVWKSAGGWAAIAAAISGSTFSYSVTDGGPLDADGTVNGEIVDPVAPVVPRSAPPPPAATAEPIPLLPVPALLALAALVGLAGLLRRR